MIISANTLGNYLYLGDKNILEEVVRKEISNMFKDIGNDCQTRERIRMEIDKVFASENCESEPVKEIKEKIDLIFAPQKVPPKKSRVFVIDTNGNMSKYFHENSQIIEIEMTNSLNPFHFTSYHSAQAAWTAEKKSRIIEILFEIRLKRQLNGYESMLIEKACAEMFKGKTDCSLEDLYFTLDSKIDVKDDKYINAAKKTLKTAFPSDWARRFSDKPNIPEIKKDIVVFNFSCVPDDYIPLYTVLALEYILLCIIDNKRHSYIYVPYDKENFTFVSSAEEAQMTVLLDFYKLCRHMNASITLYGEELLFLNDKNKYSEGGYAELGILNNTKEIHTFSCNESDVKFIKKLDPGKLNPKKKNL